MSVFFIGAIDALLLVALLFLIKLLFSDFSLLWLFNKRKPTVMNIGALIIGAAAFCHGLYLALTLPVLCRVRHYTCWSPHVPDEALGFWLAVTLIFIMSFFFITFFFMDFSHKSEPCLKSPTRKHSYTSDNPKKCLWCEQEKP